MGKDAPTNFIFLLFYPFFIDKTQEINYDSPRGGVSVITEKGEVTTSYLLIQKAKLTDSGLYTCMPTHANPNTVNVHVLNGMYEMVQYIIHIIISSPSEKMNICKVVEKEEKTLISCCLYPKANNYGLLC